MLLALESELHNSEAALPSDRILACEELLASLWSTIGETWIDGWANDADNVAAPSGGVIPAASLPRIEALEAELKPVFFGEAAGSEHLRSSKVDRSGLVVALASSRRLQEGAWLDKDALHRKLTKGWSVETALVDCMSLFPLQSPFCLPLTDPHPNLGCASFQRSSNCPLWTSGPTHTTRPI